MVGQHPGGRLRHGDVHRVTHSIPQPCKWRKCQIGRKLSYVVIFSIWNFEVVVVMLKSYNWSPKLQDRRTLSQLSRLQGTQLPRLTASQVPANAHHKHLFCAFSTVSGKQMCVDRSGFDYMAAIATNNLLPPILLSTCHILPLATCWLLLIISMITTKKQY